MAEILTKKKSTYSGPYAYYTVDVTTSSRTPLSVKLTVKVTANLAASTSLLGTGNGFGLTAGIYVGGEWHTWTLKKEGTSWSGTKKHTAETSFRVSGLSASTSSLTGVKFRCLRTSGAGKSAQLNETSCSSISVTKVSSKYSDVAIEAGEPTQKQVTTTLSGLPESMGFATEIRWYKGSSLVKTTSISSTATATSYANTFTGLLPNSNYTLKAEIYYSDDTKLVSKSIAVTTPQEEGTLALTPKATYITASVTGMFNTPNYTRSIEFHYKKSEESNYKLFSTESAQGTSISKNITGLISNAKYDIKVVIKNGSTTLKTLTASVETTEDTSLIPTAFLDGVSQQLGTRLCTLSWNVDKSVAGTTYVIEAQTENSEQWETLKTLTSPEAVTVVEATEGNINTVFRISSSNAMVAEDLVNYSEEFLFYVRDDFLWDVEKVAGQPMIITANEWNRLREYAVARNEDMGNAVDIPLVSVGDPITAVAYNTMKAAISQVTPINIADKNIGDAITAADVDALREAINTVS